MLFCQSSQEHRAPDLSKTCLSGQLQTKMEKLCCEQKISRTKFLCIWWHLRTPHWGHMSKQDGSTFMGNTATGEGTVSLPYASRSQALHPRDAVPRGAAKARTWGMMVWGAGEQPPYAALPPPPKLITTARTSEFGRKACILMPRILSKSQSGSQPCAPAWRR